MKHESERPSSQVKEDKSVSYSFSAANTNNCTHIPTVLTITNRAKLNQIRWWTTRKTSKSAVITKSASQTRYKDSTVFLLFLRCTRIMQIPFTPIRLFSSAVRYSKVFMGIGCSSHVWNSCMTLSFIRYYHLSERNVYTMIIFSGRHYKVG